MLNNASRNLLLAGTSTALLIGAPAACYATTTINVAVASNFYGNSFPSTLYSPIAAVISAFVGAYAGSTAYSVVVTQNGASGTIFNSITNSNPSNIDLVFFADNTRANTLAASYAADVTGQPFDYAVGTLVLWSKSVDVTGGWDQTQFTTPGSLALALPSAAPYGAAAQAFLQNQNYWGGNTTATFANVDLTYQAIATQSGNVTGGFVALSQICTQGTWPSALSMGFASALTAVDLETPNTGPAVYNYPVIIQSSIRVNRVSSPLTTGSAEWLERENLISFIRDRTSPTAPIIPILSSFCYGIPS